MWKVATSSKFPKRRMARSAVPLLGIGLVGKTLFAPSVQPEPASLEGLPDIDVQLATEHLAAGIRFPTVSSQLHEPQTREAFDGFLSYIEMTYPQTFAQLEVERFGSHGLLMTWAGADPTPDPILMMAHYDVVPPEPAAGETWTHAPFSGAIEDGFIWGRGALDDKIGVFGLLEATENLLQAGFTPSRTIYLAFGHDEETGGTDGAARIADHLADEGVHLAFVLDEGGVVAHGSVPGVDAPVAVVGIAEKGYATLELTVDGRGGHSSMPPRHTAIGVLASAIERIEDNPPDAELHEPIRRMLETVAPESSFVFRMGLANLWLLEPIIVRVLTNDESTDAIVRTTTAVTMIEGGTKDNVLPSSARALINFRIAPGETIAGTLEHVREVVDDETVRIRVLDDAREPSRVSSHRSENFRSVGSVARAIFPGAIVAPYLVMAGTDSRNFEGIADDVYRFLPVALAPEDQHRIHGADERVAIDDYVGAIRYYMALMATAAGNETPVVARAGS